MNESRNSFIDFGKGFSILTIVVYHYLAFLKLPGIFAKAIMLGGTGAHLFIFLSAFGLMLTSYNSILSFYLRRFVKILIPYYIVITFLFLMNLVIPLTLNTGLYAYLGHIFLFKMFDNSIVTSYGPQFWYISTIIQFYILFPFLKMLLLKIGNKSFFVICSVISVGYWIFIYLSGKSDLRIWNSSFIQYLWEFSLGMIMSSCIINGKKPFYSYKWYIYFMFSILGLGVMGVLVLKMGSFGRNFNDIPAFVGYISFCILFYRATTKYLKKVSLYVIHVGNYSYSLFLTHMFVIQLLIYVSTLFQMNERYLFLVVIIGIPLSLLFANIFNKFLVFLMKKKHPTTAST